MPDLRPLRTHEADLRQIETDLQRQAHARYTQLRVDLLDLLQHRGLPALLSQLPFLVQAARRDLERSYLQAGGTIVQQSQAAALDDLTRLAQLLDQPPPRMVPTPSPLLAIGAAQALDWLASLHGLMLIEARSLPPTTDPPLIVSRLLAPDLQAGRASLWRSGVSLLDVALTRFVWQLANHTRLTMYQQAQPPGPAPYHKQVIAAIDRRTTSCCLAAHGQIAALDQPFRLTGTPRYADRLLQPPFHARCRTSLVLYHPIMEQHGPTTADLRQRAQAEQERRSS